MPPSVVVCWRFVALMCLCVLMPVLNGPTFSWSVAATEATTNHLQSHNTPPTISANSELNDEHSKIRTLGSPLPDVSSEATLCGNVTELIRQKIETLLHLTAASAASGADLDSLDLALHTNVAAEQQLSSSLRSLVNIPGSQPLALAKAIAAYRTVIGEVPDVGPAYCRLAELLLLANETVESLTVLEELLLRWPDDVVALRMTAGLLSERGQHALAAAKWEQLIRLQVSARADYFHLAKDYLAMGRQHRATLWQQQQQQLKEADEATTSRSSSRNHIASSQLSSNNIESLFRKAEKYFRLALLTDTTTGDSEAPSVAFHFALLDGSRITQYFANVDDLVEAHMAFASALMERRRWDDAEGVVRFWFLCSTTLRVADLFGSHPLCLTSFVLDVVVCSD